MFAIESANIVGYTTKEAPKGKFIIMGAQFEGVKGGTKINDLIGGVTGVDYDEKDAHVKTAPQIQIPFGGGYKTYYYLNDGYYEDAEGNEAYKPGWCDSFGNIVDAEITPGVAMWAKSIGADAGVTVSGAVSSDDIAVVECPENFALRANIFPLTVEINGNGMTSDNIIGVAYDEKDAHMKTAPQIQIPFGGGYKTYYYLNDGYYEDAEGNEAYKPGWCDSFGNIVDATIPAAQGFWTKGVSGKFTLKFTK